jgi:hypothetical protein
MAGTPGSWDRRVVGMLLRLQNGLGNDVLWWRCGRSVVGGAHAFGESPVSMVAPCFPPTESATPLH